MFKLSKYNSSLFIDMVSLNQSEGNIEFYQTFKFIL